MKEIFKGENPNGFKKTGDLFLPTEAGKENLSLPKGKTGDLFLPTEAGKVIEIIQPEEAEKEIRNALEKAISQGRISKYTAGRIDTAEKQKAKEQTNESTEKDLNIWKSKLGYANKGSLIYALNENTIEVLKKFLEQHGHDYVDKLLNFVTLKDKYSASDMNIDFENINEIDEFYNKIIEFYKIFEIELSDNINFYEIIFFITKYTTLSKKNICPDFFLDFLIKNLEKTDNFLLIAEILKIQIDELNNEQMIKILETLDKKKYLSGDLAQIIINKFTDLQENDEIKTRFTKLIENNKEDNKIFTDLLEILSVDDIIDKKEIFTKEANNQAIPSDEHFDKKVGLEIETHLSVGEIKEKTEKKRTTSIQSRKSNDKFFELLEKYSDILEQICHKDLDSSEMKSSSGGNIYNRNTIKKWLLFIKDLQKHPEFIAFASNHVNIDNKDNKDNKGSVIVFRKNEEGRLETKTFLANIDENKFTFEMMRLFDQYQIIESFRDIDNEIMKEFIKIYYPNKKDEFLEFFISNENEITLQFFIFCAKKYNMIEIIPSILRTHDKQKLPKIKVDCNKLELEIMNENKVATIQDVAKYNHLSSEDFKNQFNRNNSVVLDLLPQKEFNVDNLIFLLDKFYHEDYIITFIENMPNSECTAELLKELIGKEKINGYCIEIFIKKMSNSECTVELLKELIGGKKFDEYRIIIFIKKIPSSECTAESLKELMKEEKFNEYCIEVFMKKIKGKIFKMYRRIIEKIKKTLKN